MSHAPSSGSPPESPALPPASYFPLRWESTGDRWWYATPIDLATANGHYELVRALLVSVNNLLIKLTSLRRLRRLEMLWDDEFDFLHAPRGRGTVARGLFRDCEFRDSGNSLIRAGYGGWLLYIAAAAGDVEFTQELLRRQALLVFGEGEYGMTDIFYAAARSNNSGVFWMLLDAAMDVGSAKGGNRRDGAREKMWGVFTKEVMNRALHSAARGGNWEVLREMQFECGDEMEEYRDVQGCTVLHAAAGNGQVKVVKNLVESSEIIDTRDNHGNTALHLAAYNGHLQVVKVLVLASPSSSATRNDAGDTFLRMAVSGFRNPGFRRIDRQKELLKGLICGEVVCLPDVINLRNNEGRTALHLAVIGNLPYDSVRLLMTVSSIDSNVCDVHGMTPLDLLNLCPRTASSEIIKKLLTSTGTTSNPQSSSVKGRGVSELNLESITWCSPGTLFRIPDSEIFHYTGLKNTREPVTKGCIMGPNSCSINRNGETNHTETMDMNYESSTIHKSSTKSLRYAANRLRTLLGWSNQTAGSKKNVVQIVDDRWPEKSIQQKHRNWHVQGQTPTPLRQRFLTSSLPNNKRTLAVKTYVTNPSSKKKFSSGLEHGVMHSVPRLAFPLKAPSMCSSKESCSSLSPSHKHDGMSSGQGETLTNQHGNKL